MFGRKVTMSIAEFCQMQRGEITLNEIKGRRYEEKALVNREYGCDTKSIESALSFMLGVVGIGLVCNANPIGTVTTSTAIAATEATVGSKLTMVAAYLLSHKLFVVLSFIIIISTFLKMKKQDTARAKIDTVVDGLVSTLMLYLLPYFMKGFTGIAGGFMRLFH